MRESIDGEDDESRQLQPSVLSYIIETREKFLAQWKGPFPVVKKVSPVDYKVRHDNGFTKVYHVNMLKRWFERNEEQDEQDMAAVCIADHLEEDN